MNEDKKLEGHWGRFEGDDSGFPYPVHTDIEHPLKQQILDAYDALLAQPQFSYGPDNWWGKEDHVRAYRGSSGCRCCAAMGIRKMNGCKEYEEKGWVWPEGFRHYISEHNIVPTKEFLKDVLNIEV
jgi:hypothetical protein